jgi:hypothetical protein
MDAGSFRMSSKRIGMASLIGGVRDAVLPSVTARHHVLAVTVADDVGDVIGDETQLERVLLNVVGNAIKFTPDPGRIELRARRDGGAVVVSVSDTGIGIPEDEVRFVFDRFHRSSIAHEQAIPGTGLGLSISKTIVEQHRGTIEMTSEQGRGTTVQVRLPRANPVALDAVSA